MHEEVAKWAGKVSLSLDNSELHKEHQLQHGFVLQLVLHFVSFAWFGLNFVHAACDLRCSRALTWQKPLQRDLPSTHGFESLAPVEEQMHPFLGGKASFGEVSLVQSAELHKFLIAFQLYALDEYHRVYSIIISCQFTFSFRVFFKLSKRPILVLYKALAADVFGPTHNAPPKSADKCTCDIAWM